MSKEQQKVIHEHSQKLSEFLGELKERGIADGFVLMGYKKIDENTIAKVFAMEGDEYLLATAYEYAKEEPKFYNILIVSSMLELEKIDTSKLKKESE